MGIPEEDDAAWATLMNSALGLGDADLNPGGIDQIMQEDIPEIFERCRAMIAERRENPKDDLTSVLVDAEIDGEKLEEHEIVMGFFLLVAAGNDSTKATYTSGMRALLEHPDEMRKLVGRPLADRWRGRGVPAHVPRLRPLPPHRDRGHRGRRLPGGRGRQGADVVRVLQPRRGEATRTPTASTSSATPSTRHSAPAAATSASAPRWRGWSCGSCSRRP